MIGGGYLETDAAHRVAGAGTSAVRGGAGADGDRDAWPAGAHRRRRRSARWRCPRFGDAIIGGRPGILVLPRSSALTHSRSRDLEHRSGSAGAGRRAARRDYHARCCGRRVSSRAPSPSCATHCSSAPCWSSCCFADAARLAWRAHFLQRHAPVSLLATWDSHRLGTVAEYREPRRTGGRARRGRG